MSIAEKHRKWLHRPHHTPPLVFPILLRAGLIDCDKNLTAAGIAERDRG